MSEPCGILSSRRRLLQLVAASWLVGCRADGEVAAWPHGALAIALSDDHVYWTSGVDHSGLLRVARAGGDPRIIYDGMPWAVDLAAGPEAMFIASARGVERAPYVGLRGQLLVPDAGGAHRLAVDGDDIFWLQRASGALRRADRKGRGARTLAQDRPWAHDFTLAGDSLFWSAGEPGRLSRVSRAGGRSEVVADEIAGLGALASDGRHVYLAAATGVSRVAIEGSAVEPIAEGRSAPSALRAMSDGVCWCEGHQLVRYRASTGRLTTRPAGLVLALAAEGETAWWIDGEAEAVRRGAIG